MNNNENVTLKSVGCNCAQKEVTSFKCLYLKKEQSLKAVI